MPKTPKNTALSPAALQKAWLAFDELIALTSQATQAAAMGDLTLLSSRIQSMAQEAVKASVFPAVSDSESIGDKLPAGWSFEDAKRIQGKTRIITYRLEELWLSLPEGQSDALARDLVNTQSILRGKCRPLFKAAMHDRVDLLAAASICCDLHETDERGRGLLANAAHWGAKKCVAYLIFRLNPQSPSKEGLTPLMDAARNGHDECVALLLPVSRTRRADGKGHTALMHAAGSGNSATIALLIPASEPKAKDKDGDTALTIAAARGAPGALNALIPVSDLNAQNSAGFTALMIAARNANFSCAQALLQAGADASIQIAGRETALSLAMDFRESDNDALQLIRALIQATPGIAELRCAGVTLLTHARIKERWQLFDWLAPFFPLVAVQSALDLSPDAVAPVARALCEQAAIQDTVGAVEKTIVEGASPNGVVADGGAPAVKPHRPSVRL